MPLPPFHLAFPVDDLSAARRFYGELLGCPEGRSASDWVDFDFHGHQIVAHLAPDSVRERATNPVDGENVPYVDSRHLSKFYEIARCQSKPIGYFKHAP